MRTRNKGLFNKMNRSGNVFRIKIRNYYGYSYIYFVNPVVDKIINNNKRIRQNPRKGYRAKTRKRIS